MGKRQSSYLCVDLNRAFEPLKIGIGMAGVCIAFLYNTDSTDVLTWLGDISGNAVLVMVALLFACYPYASAFCEDMEYHYDRQMVLRGGTFSYVISKVIAVFISSVCTMLAGFIFAALVLLIRYGVPDVNTIQEIQSNSCSLYKILLLKNQYILFGFCIALHLSILAGILAVLGLMCSLFIKNRVLVYIMPIAFLYIEDIVVQRLLGWEKGSLFSLNCMGVTTLGASLKSHSWQLYYFEIICMFLCVSAIIYWKYRKEQL